MGLERVLVQLHRRQRRGSGAHTECSMEHTPHPEVSASLGDPCRWHHLLGSAGSFPRAFPDSLGISTALLSPVNNSVQIPRIRVRAEKLPSPLRMTEPRSLPPARALWCFSEGGRTDGPRWGLRPGRSWWRCLGPPQVPSPFLNTHMCPSAGTSSGGLRREAPRE